jgi:hypothetical protein
MMNGKDKGDRSMRETSFRWLAEWLLRSLDEVKIGGIGERRVGISVIKKRIPLDHLQK